MGNWLKTNLRTLIHGKPRATISQSAFISAHQQAWIRGFPSDARKRRPPRRFGNHEVNFADMLAPIPELGTYTLPHGRATAENGWCFTSEGLIVLETTWYSDTLDREKLNHPFPKATRLTGLCLSLVSEFGAENYGHYLLDCISRLGIARQAGWTTDQIDHFYLYRPISQSAERMLSAVGIPESKCVWANDTPSIIADTLLVTTFPGTKRNYAGVVPATLCQPFSGVPTAGRRIFVPRRGIRSIENAIEIERISRNLGLDIYDFTKVEDEFTYFREADLIVGAHGAGLTNIAVCRPGTKVLELVPSDHLYPYYYSLAETAFLDYSYLVGRSDGVRAKGTWGPSPFDFFVDAEEYSAAVSQLLIELT